MNLAYYYIYRYMYMYVYACDVRWLLFQLLIGNALCLLKFYLHVLNCLSVMLLESSESKHA